MFDPVTVTDSAQHMAFSYGNIALPPAAEAGIPCTYLNAAAMTIGTALEGLDDEMMAKAVADLTDGLRRHDPERINALAVAEGALDPFQSRRCFHILPWACARLTRRAQAHRFEAREAEIQDTGSKMQATAKSCILHLVSWIPISCLLASQIINDASSSSFSSCASYVFEALAPP